MTTAKLYFSVMGVDIYEWEELHGLEESTIFHGACLIPWLWGQRVKIER